MNELSIISYLESLPVDKNLVFAIGLSSDETQAIRIIKTLEKNQKFSDNCFILVGEEEIIGFIRKMTDLDFTFKQRLGTVLSTNPAEWLIGTMLHFDHPEIWPQSPFRFCINSQMGDAFYSKGIDTNYYTKLVIIRGSLSSDLFLTQLQPALNKMNIKKPVRVAILEDAFGRSFFFGGVGIDEISNLEEKANFIKRSIGLIEDLGLKPKIAVLSAGRKTDVGRNPEIDRNIQESQQLVDQMRTFYGDLNIDHIEILIESAVSQKYNMILPPDGVSGNLIYRTMIHLGKGKSFGAVYADIFNNLGKICIDCSRIAPDFEIEGSLITGSASFFAYQKRVSKKEK